MENSSAVKTSCFHSFSRLFKPAQINNSNNVNDDKMELYIKAGPEDGKVGDCPFAHYVRCVLNYKGLECDVKPCKQETKPDWLLSDTALGGKMPCLRKGDFKMVESGAIVDHLEKTHPEPTLTSVDKEAMAAALEVQSSFFPALAKFIKTVDFDADLEQNLLAQAQKLNDHLAKEGNTYMAGKSLTLVDFSLAPKLYHMEATLKKFQPNTWDKVTTMPDLKRYMTLMFTEKAFESSKYPEATVIWGWSAARQK